MTALRVAGDNRGADSFVVAEETTTGLVAWLDVVIMLLMVIMMMMSAIVVMMISVAIMMASIVEVMVMMLAIMSPMTMRPRLGWDR